MNKSLFKMFSLVTILALMLMALPIQSVQAVSTDIVISEFRTRGPVGGNDEFIELYNLSSSPVNIGGWKIKGSNNTGGGTTTPRATIPVNTILNPGCHYLLTNSTSPGYSGSVLGNQTYGTGVTDDGGIAITTAADVIVDQVGMHTGSAFKEGTVLIPLTTNVNRGYERKPGGASGSGTDTDNNSTDFQLITPSDPQNAASPCIAAEAAPSVSTTTPANGAANVALNANITVDFSEPVNAAGSWFDITCTTSGTHTAVPSGGSTSFTLDPDTDFVTNETCTLTVLAANVTDQDAIDPPDNMTGDFTASFSTIEVCGDPATFIHAVQGNGTTSPITGSTVSIEGVVVGDYQGSGQFSGYHLQEEDADIDADLATSEGIFIFNTAIPVSAGDKVRVRGTVTEFSNLTELASVSNVQVCSSGNTVTASNVTLPVSNLSDWERYEGMLINIAQDLTATENFTLGRFGEVALSVNGRLLNPTMVAAPGAPANAVQDLNNRSRILLDDGNNQQNIDPTIHPSGGLSASNTLRSGYTVDGLTGVLEQRFGVYRVQPIGSVTFDPTNLRPAAPDPIPGRLRVAAMNVLNYFTTLNQPGNVCGPSNLECRGANSAVEFTRQRDKIISAIVGLDSDIVGLMELENNATTAIQDLVNGLNAATAPGTYAFINTGTIGTDAIKVGLIYKPATVTPLGAYAILDSSVDPTFIDTLNRPVLAQTFEETSTGARFTVAVNHLKSKGSACTSVGDPDTGDGQGNCNLTRLAAAIAEANWLATDPTNSGDPDFLLIGDFNAYLMEDPISALQTAGYTNLIDAFVGADDYSFVFQGQSGYLDHALSNPSLTSQVTGTTEWHANADEPIVLDYNTEFKSLNHVNTLYAPDAFRSSDHDPLIVGLDPIATCNGLPATIVGTPGNDVINGTNGNDVIVARSGNDIINGGKGEDVICGDDGNDTLNGDDGDDILVGGYGDDILAGGKGDDTLLGRAGDDTLTGGGGDDLLDGGANNDALVGDNGDDTLTGGTGADSFSGGPGNDTNADFNAGDGDTSDGT